MKTQNTEPVILRERVPTRYELKVDPTAEDDRTREATEVPVGLGQLPDQLQRKKHVTNVGISGHTKGAKKNVQRETRHVTSARRLDILLESVEGQRRLKCIQCRPPIHSM